MLSLDSYIGALQAGYRSSIPSKDNGGFMQQSDVIRSALDRDHSWVQWIGGSNSRDRTPLSK